jgi:hypothetical protein
MTPPGDDSMPALDISWRWVPGKYGYWVRVQEHEKALQVLIDAGMLGEVTLEELPA